MNCPFRWIAFGEGSPRVERFALPEYVFEESLHPFCRSFVTSDECRGGRDANTLKQETRHDNIASI